MKTASLPGKPAIQITIREGSNEKTLSLEQDEFVVGRDESQVDIFIDSPSVSRKHAVIRFAEGQIYVKDLKSGNGTFVRGKRLKPGDEVKLRDPDDQINIGDVAYLTFKPEAPMIVAQNEVQLYKARAIAEIEAIQAGAVEFAEALKSETLREIESLKRDTEPERLRLAELRAQIRDHEHLATECADFEARATRARETAERLERTASGLSQEIEDAESRVIAARTEADEQEAQNACLARELERQKGEIAGLQAARQECAALGIEIKDKSEHRDFLRREVMELEETHHKLELKRSEAASAVEQIERESARLAAIKAELSQLGETLEREKQVQFSEERRRKALSEAQEAEFVVKRLTLEAAMGELDLKRIEAARELQTLLDRQQIVQRDTGLTSERKLTLEKMLVTLHEKLEEDRAEAKRIESRLTAENAAFADLRSRTTEAELSFGSIQLSLRELHKQFSDEKAERQAQLAHEMAGLKDESERRIKLEFAEQGRAMERELADAKLKELSQIAQMQEEEHKAARARLEYTLEEIVRSAVDLTRQKPLEQAESEFRALVKAALEGKTSSTRSSEGAERTRKFWKKKGIQVAIPAAVILFFVIFPGIPGAVRDGVMRTIASEKNDSGVFLEQIRQRGMKYQPEMDRVYRDTYADNLLYLEGYAEMKLSKEEEGKWTLILNDLIVGRLGLSDRVIPDFISAEAVMVRELFRIREGILPQYKEQGLAHLAETEKQEGAALLKLLQTPENYKKFRDLEQSYYLDYLKRKAQATAH